MEKLKLLRDKTGAGMIDCKKAIDEANGDIDKAVEILRKKGIAKAAKRSEREACEGLIKIAVSQDAKTGYIFEINSETDFAARSEKFLEFAEKVMDLAKAEQPGNLDKLMCLNFGSGSVKENLDALSGVIGEKLDIKRYDILNSGGTVSAYSHLGGKIGVLVSLDKNNANALAYDIAMQIAASNPKYIRQEDAAPDEIEKEKEIYKSQLLKENKPESMIDKIIQGKLEKFYEEICLVKQEYIKDDSKKVEDVLGEAKVEKFIRYNL